MDALPLSTLVAMRLRRSAARITRRAFGNLNGPNTAGWRTLLAGVTGNTANGRLACIGDSTTRGLGGAGGTSGDVAGSYPSQLAPLLASAFSVAAGIGNLIGASGLTLNTIDSRVVLNGWGASAGTTAGGGLLTKTTAGTLVFTPTAAFDTVDFYVPRNSGWGSISVDIAGGSADIISNGSANGFIKQAKTGSRAVQAVNVAYNANPAFIAGIDTYDSAVKQISVWNMGWSGATAANWNNGTYLYSPKSALSLYAPQFSIINLGINDMVAATAVATFKTNLQAVIDAAVAQGGVALVVPNPISTASASQAVQDEISQAIIDLAMLNNLPFYDIRRIIPSFTAGDALGLYYGANHLSGTGYAAVAAGIAEMLQTAATLG